MSQLTPQAAAALLRDQDNLLILTHRRPDGDTTGCAAALCLALRQLGRTAFLLRNPEMTETNAVYVTELWAPEGFAPDFVVSVDIAARSLFFPAAEAYFDRIGLAVDHHPSFEGFGAHQCVDPSRAACGEIVYEICRELGGLLLSRFPHLKVDVEDPDVLVTVEVREKDAYVHKRQLPGAGGIPVGTGGKAALLLSGGIDSPVAGYMTAKRGVAIDAVYFHAPPYTSERAKQKVPLLASKGTRHMHGAHACMHAGRHLYR